MYMHQFDGLCFLSAKLRHVELQMPPNTPRERANLLACRARTRKILWEMTRDPQFLPGMAGDGNGQILRSSE